ncbi:hypothetical protein QYF36_002535 [Acer negundo]|nr:hypothetical protein QYF36_002535 [Acer negundo]
MRHCTHLLLLPNRPGSGRPMAKHVGISERNFSAAFDVFRVCASNRDLLACQSSPCGLLMQAVCVAAVRRLPSCKQNDFSFRCVIFSVDLNEIVVHRIETGFMNFVTKFCVSMNRFFGALVPLIRENLGKKRRNKEIFCLIVID